MKKKLLVLTLGALCVSQIWEHNHASAVVSGEKNPYESESLTLTTNKNKSRSIEEYKKSLEDLIWSFPNLDNEKFDEPEYKEIIKKYQQKFMAEDEALKKIFEEEKNINNGNHRDGNLIGLSHERYENIFSTLKKQNEEFLKEIEEIKKDKPELKDFSEEEQLKHDLELNTLENQILMLGRTFYQNYKDDVENLYSKLDLIMGYKDEERANRKPVNKRMFENKKEDLEITIDEFFSNIDKTRPSNIPVLEDEKQEEKNRRNISELKANIEAAKNDESKRSKRSKRSLESQKYKATTQEVTAEQKAAYERKSEERKVRFLDKQKSKNEPVVSLEYDFEHKQRVNNENDKQLIVSSPIKRPTPPTTYTETTQQVPMPTVERQTQEQIVYKAPKQLAGLNGESHDFSTTHQSPTTSNDTYSNVVEFDETSALPGRKSGSLVGLSQIDSSHLTEREKRVIKRDHVREAQKLVENYKDTHSYKDRLNAQQKVNTLSEGHQKRFNKQINKVYNGK
ncbi:TPA: von Willebrand factor binding protein Vwb [Staphylococcus argenteus]|uniref:von Willebrand factor binding protein Vwb n=1 Tax=Staphylococcus argenteus TaxID=985002 RepID=UPI000233FDAE|nr:von Willebrand factor binding protein Vwb [Staphylococcus argenteus]MBE2130391.1 von Willebrand factor binding protein Vwb [Staphylococcus argenteus]PNY93183.1 coagulase [Staphylococcus argenteus]CCE58591.1 putative exported protein [Staphylococcus argenteus]SUJ06381.1 putative von Willebrand factor-binding protein precursor [Staphylococcus argenteus]HDY9428395.1 von Willebrand factor binding protein Vwb [Staphylococcus argenteus]